MHVLSFVKRIGPKMLYNVFFLGKNSTLTIPGLSPFGSLDGIAPKHHFK